jgi:hypothetical protein
MSRKPITEYVGGKGPRQQIWEHIRAMGEEDKIFSAAGISREIKVETDAVRDYLNCLLAAKIVHVINAHEGRGKERLYFLDRDEGIEAPRVRKDGTRVTQGLAQEQMWRTLRLLSGDTCGRELAAHASTPTIPVSEVAAQHYLLMLNQAGYLNCTKEGRGLGFKGAGIQARYRLKPGRNTGPRPPMVCRAKVVYDPNEDKVVWAPPVSDEDAIHGR